MPYLVRVALLVFTCLINALSIYRLNVYFSEKDVFWRDDSGFVELPRWILVRSFLMLGYDGTTKVRCLPVAMGAS